MDEPYAMTILRLDKKWGGNCNLSETDVSDLIDYVKFLHSESEKDYADMRRFQAKFMEADQELQKLLSERGWIPVSERLPLPVQKADGYISDSSELVHVFPRPEKDRAVCYLHYLGKWSCSAEVKVTHWMPLSPPPDEKGGE